MPKTQNEPKKDPKDAKLDLAEKRKNKSARMFLSFSGQIRLHGSLPILLFDAVMENATTTVRLTITANEFASIQNDDTNLGSVLLAHASEIEALLNELDGLMNAPVVYPATDWTTFKTEIQGIIQP